MEQVIDAPQGVPQAHEFLFDDILFRIGRGFIFILEFLVMPLLPQTCLIAGIKECREQAFAENPFHLLFHIGSEVVTAQAVQVVKVAVYRMGIGKRLVNVIEVAKDELCPIDELVKLLGLTAHRLTIGLIQGENHLDVGGTDRIGQSRDKPVNRGH